MVVRLRGYSCILHLVLHIYELSEAHGEESLIRNLEAHADGSTWSKLEGYEPSSDVIKPSEVDLDQKKFELHLDTNPPNFALAKAVYTADGLVSDRPILGSVSDYFTPEMPNEELHKVYWSYYNNHSDYAQRFVLSALDATGDFQGQDYSSRVEAARLGSVCLNVWMRVIGELEEAITSCQSGCKDCNKDAAHNWDEAVAFYVGSLATSESQDTGNLLYALADELCVDFGTCTAGADGTSTVNVLVIAEFVIGQAKLLQGKCDEVHPIKKRIIELMSIPLVQGALLSGYNIIRNGTSKAKGRGAAFAAAILPRVAACSTDSGFRIETDMNIGADIYSHAGYSQLKKSFELTYDCLGITCTDVGGLTAGYTYFEHAEPCVDTTQSVTPAATVVGTTRIPDDQDDKIGGALVIVIMCLLVILLCMCSLAGYCYCRARKYQRLAEGRGAAAGGTVVGAPRM